MPILLQMGKLRPLEGLVLPWVTQQTNLFADVRSHVSVVPPTQDPNFYARLRLDSSFPRNEAFT